MTMVDWLVVVVFVLSVSIGFVRGFIREALSIASWIVALWLAFNYSTEVGDYIAQYVTIEAPAFRSVVGFVTAFIAGLFVFSLISFVVTKILTVGPIKGVDRVLGLFFGFIRAVAVVAVLMVLGRGFGMENSQMWKESSLIENFIPAANALEKILPDELKRDSQVVPADEPVNQTELQAEL